MLLCFAPWDRPGGLATMMRFYYTLLDLQIPHCWVLIGKTPPPEFIRANENTLILSVNDDWNIYTDPSLCDPLVKKQITQFALEHKVTSLFLPLEYHYSPYVLDLKLPQFYISHLLHAPLIKSVLKQTYADLPEVQKELHADRVRLKIEEQTIKQSQWIVSSCDSVLEELKKHYALAPDCILQSSELGVDKDQWSKVKFNHNGQSLFFGRLSHQKGIPSLIRGGTKNLSIMGKGKLETLLSKNSQIRPLDWLNKVDLQRELDNYQFCIFPSHYEPWGLSLNEALVAGKICLAQSGVAGHELQIDHGKNGFLVNFNKKTLDEIISELHYSEKEFIQIAQNARQTARAIEPHIDSIRHALTQFSDKYSRMASKP